MSIERVCVVGAGVMGRQIALDAALHGVAATLTDASAGALAGHEEVDLAAEKGLGHPMGPFRLMDLVGLDVVSRVAAERQRETGREADGPDPLVEEKVRRGDLGRKSGRGWYDYGEGGSLT